MPYHMVPNCSVSCCVTYGIPCFIVPGCTGGIASPAQLKLPIYHAIPYTIPSHAIPCGTGVAGSLAKVLPPPIPCHTIPCCTHNVILPYRVEVASSLLPRYRVLRHRVYTACLYRSVAYRVIPYSLSWRHTASRHIWLSGTILCLTVPYRISWRCTTSHDSVSAGVAPLDTWFRIR